MAENVRKSLRKVNYNFMFQVPATIQGISTLRDKTLKLCVYVSKEISGEEKAKIFDLEQCEGWFIFSVNSLKEKDIPKEETNIKMEEKSASQRLRAVIYRFWEQNYSQKTEFQMFYDMEIEKIIDSFKQKLK